MMVQEEKKPRGQPPKEPEERKVNKTHRLRQREHEWIIANREYIEKQAKKKPNKKK